MRNSEQLTRLGRLLTLMALCGLAGSVQLGCDTDDGPAEDTGEAIDDAGDEMEDAVDDIGKAASPADPPISPLAGAVMALA